MDYEEIITKIKIPRTCKTCLYGDENNILRSCKNANNGGKPMAFVNGGKACRWYWLNQHKYPRY